MSCTTTVVVLLLCVAAGSAVKWINCPGASLKGVVSDLKIPGCETTPICKLKKGVNVSFEIDFTIKEDAKAAKSVVHGIIAGVPFPFNLDNPDVCSDSGVTCPMKSGSQYTYKTHIYVKPEYPSVSVKVKWEIVDPDGNDIVCIMLPAELSGQNSKTSKSAADNRILFRSNKL